MTVVLDTSGGQIGGGDRSGIAVAPGLTAADSAILSTLMSTWGDELASVYTAYGVADPPQVRYTEQHVDDAPIVAPTQEAISGWLGGSPDPTTPLADAVDRLAVLGALVGSATRGNGQAAVTVQHHVASASGGQGQTWLLAAVARTVDVAASQVGVTGYGALYYLGLLFVGVPLTPEQVPRSAQEGPNTVDGLTVTWVDPPG